MKSAGQPTLWTISALARELDRDRHVLSRALAGTTPDGMAGPHPGWRLPTALHALAEYDRANGGDRVPARGDAMGEAAARAHRTFTALEAALQRLRDEPTVEARRRLAKKMRIPLGPMLKALDQLGDGNDTIGAIVRDTIGRQVVGEVLELLNWRLEEVERAVACAPR